jgi:tetratricopeptide (TPR) repeat protein
VPFVFDRNNTSVAEYTSAQIENISKKSPEFVGLPSVLNNGTVKNNFWEDRNITWYLRLAPYSIREDQYWLNAGNQFYDRGNYNESIECYDRAIEENSQSADAWNRKGNALYKLGRYKDAKQAFDQATKINPNYINLQNKIALKTISQEA